MYFEGNGEAPQEYMKVIQYIYGLMSDGTLSVGSRLPTERAIAEALHIGRNSTREALSILHGMGLIERRQGSGNYVSENAGASIGQTILMLLALRRVSRREICEFRRIMEKAVCSTLIEKGIGQEHRLKIEKCLKGLEQTNADMKKYSCDDGGGEADIVRLAMYDEGFHDALIRATKNSLMITIMDAVTKVYGELIGYVLHMASDIQRERLAGCHRGMYTGLLGSQRENVMKEIDMHYDIIEELIEKNNG